MSLSKNHYQIYFNKFYYGCSIVFCTIMDCIGVRIYSRMLWNQPYLTKQLLLDATFSKLKEWRERSIIQRTWHLKFLFGNIVIISLIIGYTKGIDIFTEIKYGLYGMGVWTVCNIYGILTHTYNLIRIERQGYLILEGKNIQMKQYYKRNDSFIVQLQDNKKTTKDLSKNWYFKEIINYNGEDAYLVNHAYFVNLSYQFSNKFIAFGFYQFVKKYDDIVLESIDDTDYNILLSNYCESRNIIPSTI